jgi:PiT family inorganic phosphate transporter
MGQALVLQFTGRGIVPDQMAGNADFALGVGAGAATAVLLATRLGLPISTTHALIGGLVGAGLAQNGGIVHFGSLAGSFLLPLLLSPLVAATLAAAAGALAQRRGGGRDCACVTATADTGDPAIGTALMAAPALPRIVIASDADCDRMPGTLARLHLPRSMDAAHIASAASICFARGVNDTPKLVALLMTAQAIGARGASVVVTIAMVLGGLVFARRVARTMSLGITPLDHVRGLSANLVTAGLVLLASKFGLPVSTTHVSVGSIVGIGMGGHTIDWRTTRGILLSWVGTLPLAAAAAFAVARLVAS